MLSENGRGTLTIRDVKESDQGAYTCEAINAKGLVFGIPDGVLTLTSTSNPGTSVPNSRGVSDTSGNTFFLLKCLLSSSQETVLRVISRWRVAASPASVLESQRAAKTPDAITTTLASDSQMRMTSKAPILPKMLF